MREQKIKFHKIVDRLLNSEGLVKIKRICLQFNRTNNVIC